jgi:hypothetical protein
VTSATGAAPIAAIDRDASLGDERWTASALVFALAAGFSCWTALPGPHWFDTPELTAVGVALSTSHPPGHPLHALFVRAVTLAPFGDVGFRGNVSSALAFSLALAVFYRVLRASAPAVPRALALCAALTPMFVPMLWFQAIRSEVYALQFLCSALIARLCQRVASGADLRDVPLLVLALGVAGSCHTFIAALWLPIALWALAAGARARLRARPESARAELLRAAVAAVPAAVIALSIYSYLPLRALGGGDVGWGTPDSLGELWRTLSAEQWQRVAAQERAPVGALQNAYNAFDYVFAQLGAAVTAILFGVFALGLLGLIRARSGSALVAIATVLLVFAARVIDPLNPDLGGYLLHGFAALLLLIWLAADASASTLPVRWAPWAFALVLALCVARFDLRATAGARIPERLGRALLAEVPVAGTLVTSEYSTTFMQWYLQVAEGLRPDVARVFRAQLDSPWLVRRLASAHPKVAARVPHFPRSFTHTDVRFEPGVELERLRELVPRLVPSGLTFSVGGRPTTASELDRIDARLLRGEQPAADGRRMLAYFSAQHAVWLLAPRKPARPALALAASDLRRAERFAPNDALLAELRRRLAQLGWR